MVSRHNFYLYLVSRFQGLPRSCLILSAHFDIQCKASKVAPTTVFHS